MHIVATEDFDRRLENLHLVHIGENDLWYAAGVLWNGITGLWWGELRRLFLLPTTSSLDCSRMAVSVRSKLAPNL